MADKKKIVYWSKNKKTSSSSSSLDLSRSGNDRIRCSSSPTAKERFTMTPSSKQSVSEVRMWQTTCHANTFLSASLLKDCFSFVFKWTVNDFDASVETLAIRESTLASIPCQGLTLNWRAAVKKEKKTHTLKRTSPICTRPRGPDHTVPSEKMRRRWEGGGAKRCSRRSLTRSEWRALRSRR